MALASIDALFILCFPLKGIYFLGFFFFFSVSHFSCGAESQRTVVENRRKIRR